MISIWRSGFRVCMLSALLASLVTLQTAVGHASEPAAGRSGIGTSFSYAPIYQFATNLDSGGEFDVQRHFLRFDISRAIDRRWMIGVGLSFDYERWHFSDVPGLSGIDPWDEIFRPGISLPVFYRLDGNWRFGIIPTVEAAGASGAEVGESLSYGVVLSAAYSFGPDLTLGLGAGIFERLDQTDAFPYMVIDWKITDHLSLRNPFRAGPVGPAGLELVYTPSKAMETGVGGAYRSYRFRLDDSSVVANGIGEVDCLAMFVRVGWRLGQRYQLDVNGGMLFEGSIAIEDQHAHKLGETDHDAAPFLGLTFRGRF